MNPEKRAVIDDAKDRMEKTIHSLLEDLSQIRAGKANPAILSKIQVSSYGGHIYINQMANIFIQDIRTLVVEPWDKSTLKDIEKAIEKANIGVMPVNDGERVRLPFPALTHDRREELAKVLHKMGESAKVAIRNIRRDGNDHLKKLEKEKVISEDELHRAEKEVQEATDSHISSIDKEIKIKEIEIRDI
ncbi:MAG: ribosome recycling factor [Caldisericia bacterium]|nr:ribosome recycling factor [Caldisericia bacterium]MDD4615226.1 ribosome recycling factor [Caldisericia bacterium]